MNIITHFYLVSSLRMLGSLPSLPLHNAWCLDMGTILPLELRVT